MASDNESITQLKPPMHFMLPHEIFHVTKPAHQWYEHRDNHDYDDDYYDDDDEEDYDGDGDEDDSVCSLLEDEIDQHEFDSPEIDDYTLSLDGSNPTLHQDHDQDDDYDEDYLTEPLSSPPRSASFFDCNMCMKMARQPVVTSCGHLYCWPCLYSLLSQRECLVCKSKVFDSLITPIYNSKPQLRLQCATKTKGAFSSTLKISINLAQIVFWLFIMQSFM
ncbi:hypothetical protein L3X38_013084 [Prunus dulcis]|uniref:E3 ubiquitin-protein ligase RMA n=1 Tax=Prunus dulcis TaxID=3755 RepID=A0AAD4WMS7_PRUDU|nr:hypothetical protein L3X38_013084 [Prunus dulcis]